LLYTIIDKEAYNKTSPIQNVTICNDETKKLRNKEKTTDAKIVAHFPKFLSPGGRGGRKVLP
jgi:hypothetical protein